MLPTRALIFTIRATERSTKKEGKAKQSTLMYFLLFCSAFQRIFVVLADNKLLLPAASFPGSMPDSLSVADNSVIKL